MIFAQDFVLSLFSGCTISKEVENDEEYLCEFSSETYLSPSAETIVNLSFLSERDRLKLTVTFGTSEAISWYSDGSVSFGDFINQLNNDYVYFDEGDINVILKITKEKADNSITIFNLDAFVKNHKELKVSQSFAIFNRILDKADFIVLHVHGLKTSFNTKSIYFTPFSEAISVPISERRIQVEAIELVSHFVGQYNLNLCPDDFKLITVDPTIHDIYYLFNHYTFIWSVIYLFDITTLKDDNLEYKINGYKSFKGNVDIRSFPIDGTGQYYEIFKWVYTGGNLNDKIGLSRNIISLHFEESGKLSLKGNPFKSIQSSFKVYEKQNIKQYIEIRNKISDQLLDFNNRANKVIETFATGFQKSALATITFYISAIAIKVLGKGDFIGVFTLESTILSIAFLICSLLYFFVSRWEVFQQKKRFMDSYSNLKDRYTDLLDKDDINRILNNNKEYNADVKFINDKLKAYTILWISYMSLLFIITIILHIIYIIDNSTLLKFVSLFKGS